jgi:hypothetical protein
VLIRFTALGNATSELAGITASTFDDFLNGPMSKMTLGIPAARMQGTTKIHKWAMPEPAPLT